MIATWLLDLYPDGRVEENLFSQHTKSQTLQVLWNQHLCMFLLYQQVDKNIAYSLVPLCNQRNKNQLQVTHVIEPISGLYSVRMTTATTSIQSKDTLQHLIWLLEQERTWLTQ